ncbi:MAG: capsular biosynthesis protein [Candidatus Cloacimonetes bacterium]|nr:capsular biosynthesis protein [Candidatus Cloacimonadota bacterium]
MIDIHTHILPACDDGSPDMETSLKKIRKMAEAGIDGIVLTPHFMRNQYHNTFNVITSKFKELKSQLKKENIPVNIYQAAEVYLDGNIIKDIKSEKLVIADTNYVLVETNLTGFPSNLFDILYELVKSGYRPILAHPERYANIINDPSSAEDLVHRDIYMQLNAGSLIGHYGRSVKKAAWYLLEKGLTHFLASDDHCKSEDYSLPAAMEEIRKQIDDYTVKLLTEVNPEKMLNNEKIDFFYLESTEDAPKGLLNRIFR